MQNKTKVSTKVSPVQMIKRHPILTACLAVGLLAGACGGEIPGEPEAGRQQSSTFSAGAALCGTHVSFQGFVGGPSDSDADVTAAVGRPIALLVELSVCGGEQKSDEGTAWRAIAAGISTQLVALSADETTPAAKLFLGEDGQVTARDADGTAVTLGKITEMEEGYPITLAAGVSAGVYVDGHPFSLATDHKDSAGQVAVFNIAAE